MADFTIYQADGRIIASGSCPANAVQAQLGNYPDCFLLNVGSNPRTDYVQNGVVTAMPPRPGDTFAFDYQSGQWMETRSAADIIKARRDIAIQSGITVNGFQIATDELSQQRIMGAALSAMLDSNYSVQWKVSSTQFVTLDATQIMQFAQLVRAHVQACFDNEAALLVLAQAGQPYDVETGWP